MLKQIYQDLDFIRGLSKDEVMELAFIVKNSFDNDNKVYRKFMKLYDEQLNGGLSELDYQYMLKLIIILTLRGEK